MIKVILLFLLNLKNTKKQKKMKKSPKNLRQCVYTLTCTLPSHLSHWSCSVHSLGHGKENPVLSYNESLSCWGYITTHTKPFWHFQSTNVGFPPHTATSKFQHFLCVLQFNSILTLFTWRAHQILQATDS